LPETHGLVLRKRIQADLVGIDIRCEGAAIGGLVGGAVGGAIQGAAIVEDAAPEAAVMELRELFSRRFRIGAVKPFYYAF
jgi:hypothetical protein